MVSWDLFKCKAVRFFGYCRRRYNGRNRMITKETFGARLSELRIGGGQNSAREMSLALGQNPSYINRIENGKALPSMQGFFSICEYLQITPGEFFNEETGSPREIRELTEKMEKLTSEQRNLIRQVIEQFLGKEHCEK